MARGFGRYVDRTVAPGGRYYYRLASALDGTPLTPATLVAVPLRALVLLGARPNPANEKAGWTVAFELADASPGTLELFDVSGRRIIRKLVSRKDPPVNLSEGVTLKPGLYIIRLTQGDRSVTARVTVVR